MGKRYTDSYPEVWIKMETTKNSTDYYKYILLYVNDVLHLAKYTHEDILKLKHIYWLNGGFGPPDRYPRDNVNKFQLEDRRNFWSMICIEYLRGDIKNVYSILEGNKAALKSFRGGHRPYPSSYRTEF